MSTVEPLADAGLVRRHALATQRHAVAVTLLDIGAAETVVVSGRAGVAPSIFRLAIGTQATGPGGLRTDPPTPLELENAIAVVENAVMPLAHHLPKAPDRALLYGNGGAIDDLARVARSFGLAGAAGEGEIRLTLDGVERLFQQLAAVAEGRPAASSGLPGGPVAGPAFAAALLIVREFMHHLGFAAIVVGAGAGQTTGA